METVKNDGQQSTGDLGKWARATIGLELRGLNHKQREEQKSLIRNADPAITPQMRLEAQRKLYEDSWPRKHGSAVFLRYNGRHFLVSARHVLEDTTIFHEGNLCTYIYLIKNPSTHESLPVVRQWGNQLISIDDPMAIALSGYMVGEDNEITYLLSTECDLGIINLDAKKEGKEFIATLCSRGYAPVEIQDIETCFRRKPGDSIFVVGYPSVSLVDRVTYTMKIVQDTRSSETRLPVITKGVVSKIDREVTRFEADVFTYEGNSGGPVVSSNKLIGIVSGAELDPYDDDPSGLMFATGHWMNVKASYIIPILDHFATLKQNPQSRGFAFNLFSESIL